LAKTLPIGFSLKMFYPEAFEFSKWLENKLTGKDFTYLFPIETNSLLGLHFYRPKKKIVYYNMELLDWEKENPLYAHKLFLKNLEYRMIRRIGKVVIQSHKRAQIFSKINHFNPKNILILPVTSTGDPIKKKSRYFRELFNVSKNKKIVIYAGAFAPWAQCLEIIRSVTDWPQDFVLVMHTGNPKMLKSDYFKKMQRAAQNLPVYFSTKPLEYKNLALALSSADIGLLFYEAIDNNFTKILFSSNKMSEYLKAGLPVLTSSFPELRRFVRKNKIGASIGSPAKLSQILKIIKPQLAKLSRNAQKCYQRYFRFETYFKSFYHQLFPNAKEE
jgi:glycosyltransferase involved in cell wall biosynthesis